MTTATSPPVNLAEHSRDRSASNASKHADYPDRTEPRSGMTMDYTINASGTRHQQPLQHYNEHGSGYSEYHDQQQQQQQQHNDNTSNGNGHNNHYSTLPVSSQSHYPHVSTSNGPYLPPPIQTAPFGNGPQANGLHSHSQTPIVSPSPLSSGNNAHAYQQQQGHYDYDQYHAQPYHAQHASYPQDHHPHLNHPYNNHHGNPDDLPESPIVGPDGMPINGRDPSTAYSTSAPSPTSAQAMFANRTKRRSEVFAPHESPYFYPAQQHYNLCSMDRSTSYNIKIAAKIDRGFFLAANDWTCYRRNYFQISASFSIHGLDTSMHPEVPCLMDRNGEFVQVNKFLICIGAQIQNGEKAIELVQHTPKRDKGPQITPRPTPLRAGGDLSMYSSGSNPNVVTFERVQFKTATANNGKRRAAQQYYQVHVDLFAETSMGEMVLVARSFSAPLVVRGRSPGHYADNEENAGSATQPVDDRYYRNDSISSNGGTAPSVNGDYPYYPNYGYGSSYQYQSLGSASHIASQSDPNYYERHGSESSYPTSPLSPQARHPGSYMTPQIHHGFSPASVSPDMYSPPSFIGAGPESPINRLPHDGHYTYGSSPYSQYPQQQQQQEDAQGQYPAQYEPEDHEAQMAGLRIHSPVSPGSPVQASARRQSFSSSLSSKKVDRNVVGPARKPRSISMSGISKRAPSKTRPSSSRTVPVSPTKESMKGLGISTDRILEEEHQS